SCDSTPRSLPFLILKSPGKTAPMVATGAFMPARTLGAPHTICNGSPEPIFTVVTRRRSASGCCSTVKTSPTTTPVKGFAAGASSSTSRPSIVSWSDNFSLSMAGLTHVRSQFSLIFIDIKPVIQISRIPLCPHFPKGENSIYFAESFSFLKGEVRRGLLKSFKQTGVKNAHHFDRTYASH